MISVIVPSFNVAPYLERCVYSLLGQTYTNLEIILVDDGSTDNTGELCDRMKKKDPRIKVIHKSNGGLSDARNAGIDAAKGDFLSFIDGDDFIETDTYETMISEMGDPFVSIVAGGFIVTDIEGNMRISMSPEKKILTRQEAFRDLFGENYITQSSCNKLFRSNLFEQIRYKKGIINEDMEILPRILDISDRIVLLNKPIYHYEKKVGSITSSDYSIERYQAIEIERNIYSLCRKKYPALKPYAGFYELKSLYEMLCNLRGCSNYADFKRQEIVIRWRIVYICVRCLKWKVIRKLHKNEIKTFFIMSLCGIRLVEKITTFKNRTEANS